MAYSTNKILSIIFLAFISQGYSKCSSSDISVSQSQTGAIVKGKPEWIVTVTNKCPCGQKNVILNCSGFQSVEYINPSILTVSAGTGFCLVKAGQPIYQDVVQFKYASDHSFPFNPISSQTLCS